MRTGVLISDMSTTTFVNNQIIENYFIGILIRDNSNGAFRDNFVKQNVIQFYLSKDCLKLKDNFRKNNTVERMYETAEKCVIF